MFSAENKTKHGKSRNKIGKSPVWCLPVRFLGQVTASGPSDVVAPVDQNCLQPTFCQLTLPGY